ncbi:hypothetical protein K9M41_04245, partial [Candidatus Gracilibacteria bacterium]|nr:hypothetical protein [Candidatus Gracilibacteria bacterium]
MSKKTYFIIALIFALFGLIIAFENIATTSAVLILFSSVNQSLFFPFMLLFIIGMACGFFLGLSYKEKSQKQV